MRLLLEPTWINRRVESVLLSPTGETKRRVSFDISLPADLTVAHDACRESPSSRQGQGQGAPVDVVVPLCFMRKEALVDLDVTDAGGTTLAVLSGSDNGDLAQDAICWLLRRLTDVGDRFAGAVHEVIAEKSVSGNAVQVRAARRKRFEHIALVAGDPRAVTTPSSMVRDLQSVEDLADHLLRCAMRCPPQEVPILQAAASLLSTMSDSYVFAVRTQHVGSERTVIKMSYACTIQTETRLRPRMLEWLLPSSTTVSLSLGLMTAASTHVELAVPADVAIVALEPEPSGMKYEPWSGPAASTENRLHAFANRSVLRGVSSVELVVGLAPRRNLLVVASLIAGLIAFLGTTALLIASSALVGGRTRARH